MAEIIKLDADAADKLVSTMKEMTSSMEEVQKSVTQVRRLILIGSVLTDSVTKPIADDVNSISKALESHRRSMGKYTSLTKEVVNTFTDEPKQNRLGGLKWITSGLLPLIFGPLVPLVPLVPLLIKHIPSDRIQPTEPTKPDLSKITPEAKDEMNKIKDNAEDVIHRETEIRLHDYSGGVKPGEIRWCGQDGDRDFLRDNGWADGGNPAAIGEAGGQCNSACGSMGLSYLGYDVSPSRLDPPGNGSGEVYNLDPASFSGSRQWSAPDGSTVTTDSFANCNMDDINNRVSNFINDGNRGNTAPVMIHYQKPGGGQHWIMLTGRNPDGTYNAIGPGNNEKGFVVNIDQSGNISDVSGSSTNHTGSIDRYAQHTRQ